MILLRNIKQKEVSKQSQMEIDEQRQTKQINTSSNLDLSIDRKTQRGGEAAQQAAATTTNNGSIEL